MPERTRELTVLVLGDVAIFIIALFATLFVRYLEVPTLERISLHFWPFLFMSGVWVVGFYIGGLYDKLIAPIKASLVARIITTQIVNVLLSLVLFLALPFGITPKTNLIIYLIISVLLLTLWRWKGTARLRPRSEARALLLADGEEALEFVEEINSNDRYPYYVHNFLPASHIANTKDAGQKILELVKKERITMLIVEASRPEIELALERVFDDMFATRLLQVYDFTHVYEATFDKVPLSTVGYQWCIDALTHRPRGLFKLFKRAIDVVAGIAMGVCLLLLLPLVWIATRLSGDKGPLFITQFRVGRHRLPITVLKLRTMTTNRAMSDTWAKEEQGATNEITAIGAILRKLSIDELPQAVAIIKGDMSLIGPRSDISGLFDRMKRDIPYYEARVSVTPGLSGWAQTNQRYKEGNISPQSLAETKERLAYDLFYVKHQSLLLDITIILKTIKALVVRAASVLR